MCLLPRRLCVHFLFAQYAQKAWRLSTFSLQLGIVCVLHYYFCISCLVVAYTDKPTLHISRRFKTSDLSWWFCAHGCIKSTLVISRGKPRSSAECVLSCVSKSFKLSCCIVTTGTYWLSGKPFGGNPICYIQWAIRYLWHSRNQLNSKHICCITWACINHVTTAITYKGKPLYLAFPFLSSSVPQIYIVAWVWLFNGSKCQHFNSQLPKLDILVIWKNSSSRVIRATS